MRQSHRMVVARSRIISKDTIPNDNRYNHTRACSRTIRLVPTHDPTIVPHESNKLMAQWISP